MLSYSYQKQFCRTNRVEFGMILDLIVPLRRTSYSFVLQIMQQGIIARLTDKGFGFITREGEEKDLFFHSNELVDVSYNDLREGDKVEFEVEEGPKGLNAVKVKKVA